MNRATLRLTIAALMVVVCGWAHGQDAADNIAPEIATGISDRQTVSARRFMVAAANPYAVKAGAMFWLPAATPLTPW